jgi:clan AA aspartic protease (TIGR02281 family)
MLCPKCEKTIPFHLRNAPACECGWTGAKKKEANNMGLLVLVLVMAGAVGAWVLYQDNIHAFHPDDAAADKHLAMGKDFLAKQDYANAVLELQQAVKYNPNRADAHFQLFHAYRKTNDMAQAVEEIKQAAAIKPDDYKIQEVYGEGLEQSDEQDKALDQFLLVAKKFPKDYVSLEHAALCAERLGNNDKAVDIWYEVLKRNPRASEAWINLGRLAFRENRPDEAIKIYKQALEKDPRNPTLWYQLGIGYNDMGKRQEALDALHKCVELEPAYTGYVGDVIANITTGQKRPTYLLPMGGVQGCFTVEGILNEKTRITMLVDSGANTTLISTRAAKELGIKLDGLAQAPYRSASGVFMAKTTVLHTVRVGQARARDVRVMIYDMGMESAEGLLGMTFLEQFKFTIDSHRKQLTLTPR